MSTDRIMVRDHRAAKTGGQVAAGSFRQVPMSRSSNEWQELQRLIGNQAVNRVMQTSAARRSSVDDDEREADQVAAQVVDRLNSSGESIGQGKGRRRASAGEMLTTIPIARRSSVASGITVTPALEARIELARGEGQPLAADIRLPMEQAMGADFSRVRLHTGGNADQLGRQLHARAFTTEQDIFLRHGEYRPGQIAGQSLLAHELAHVVQQSLRPARGGRQRQGLTVQAKLEWSRSDLVEQAGHPLGRSREYRAIVQALSRYEALRGRATRDDVEQLQSERIALTQLDATCLDWLTATDRNRRSKDRAPERRSVIERLRSATRREASFITNALVVALRGANTGDGGGNRMIRSDQERADPARLEHRVSPSVSNQGLMSVPDINAGRTREELRKEVLVLYKRELREEGENSAKLRVLSLMTLLERARNPNLDESTRLKDQALIAKGEKLLMRLIGAYVSQLDATTFNEGLTGIDELDEMIARIVVGIRSGSRENNALATQTTQEVALRTLIDPLFNPMPVKRAQWEKMARKLSDPSPDLDEACQLWKVQVRRLADDIAGRTLLPKLPDSTVRYHQAVRDLARMTDKQAERSAKILDGRPGPIKLFWMRRKIRKTSAEFAQKNAELNRPLPGNSDQKTLQAVSADELKRAIEATTVVKNMREAVRTIRELSDSMFKLAEDSSNQLVTLAVTTESGDYRADSDEIVLV